MPTQRRPTAAALANQAALANLSATDHELLTLVGDHGAIALDQLAQLLGLSLPTLRKRVKRLESIDCLRSCAPAVDRYRWVWLAKRSVANHFGVGYLIYPPNPVGLNHRRVIAAARIELGREFPDGCWSAPKFTSGSRRPAAIPDGVFEIDAQRWAVESELARKGAAKVRRHVSCLLEHHDKVIYYCSERVMSTLQAVSSEYPSGQLELRPAATATWFTPPSTREVRGGYRLVAKDRALLRLIVEEGTVAVDQLAQLLRRDPVSVQDQLDALREQGLLEQGFALPGKPGWVWCTSRGTRASGSPLSTIWRPGPSRLERRRALMSVRLALTGPGRPARWVTNRVLSRGIERGIQLDMALLERGSGRTAIVVSPGPRVQYSRTAQSIGKLRERYGSVRWYCPPSLVKHATHVIAELGYTGVEILDLPAQ
jgi:predicted transcriptional regulator